MANSTNVELLAQAIGGDLGLVWSLVNGKANDLTALTTTQKTTVVTALNSLKSEVDAIIAAGNYSDAQADSRVQAAKGNFTTPSATEWGSTQDIATKIAADITTAVDGLINGAPGTLDTLSEIATALGDNPDVINNILASLGKRVRVDQPQPFTAAEQLMGNQNLGLGDPTTDFVAAYNASRDAA